MSGLGFRFYKVRELERTECKGFRVGMLKVVPWKTEAVDFCSFPEALKP